MSHPDAVPLDLDVGLRRLGHSSFRPGQREAIETLLAAGRLLLVAPTGGGKSLTYQLPALLLPGTTLVVSPLVALMADQVRALEGRGVAATYLAATLPSDEMRRRLGRVARGELSLVYVAPERLAFPGFRALLAELACPLVAIDEAHCISEWGHDFRPEYGQLGELVATLPRARVLACTATATPIVRDEILARLGLPSSTPQLVRGFARPNLGLRVAEIASARERALHVDAALQEALGSPARARGAAIVYAPTRRAAEEEGGRLAKADWRSAVYHAGLAPERRESAQAAFAEGRCDVVVATNAFGMGIDRADVRAVVHLAPPASVEAWYQEVGRAGRDGEPALGLLLLSPGDLGLRRRLLEREVDGRAPDPEIVRHKWGLFLELLRVAEGGSCRHDAILRYFGDEEETLAGCGRCDVCRRLDGDADEAMDASARDLVVRKALSAVARVHGRFGVNAAVSLLRGVDDPRVARSGLRETPTFGALRERTEEWLQRLLRRCVTAGWIDFLGAERPVAVLTEAGRAVMRGERAVRLMLPPVRTPRTGRGADAGAAEGRGTRAGRAAPVAADLDEAARALFEALRAHRLSLARREGVPPYVVASDRTLRDIALLRPRDRSELQLAHGIGPAKAERYGEGFLSIVRGA
ncbi:MAG TPA: ATP-dependent DNA helicase RecQ [Myxococcota bacterium]|jgi:ATP-dependent DNA helicase RecQ|nr:ATP-dependent DNA helicase RecQ [Myxococcota bacterium]